MASHYQFEPIDDENVGLEQDDNTLDAEHALGLAQDASENHPQPLGLGEDIQNADRIRRGQPPSVPKYSGKIGGEKYEGKK